MRGSDDQGTAAEGLSRHVRAVHQGRQEGDQVNAAGCRPLPPTRCLFSSVARYGKFVRTFMPRSAGVWSLTRLREMLLKRRAGRQRRVRTRSPLRRSVRAPQLSADRAWRRTPSLRHAGIRRQPLGGASPADSGVHPGTDEAGRDGDHAVTGTVIRRLFRRRRTD